MKNMKKFYQPSVKWLKFLQAMKVGGILLMYIPPSVNGPLVFPSRTLMDTSSKFKPILGLTPKGSYEIRRSKHLKFTSISKLLQRRSK
jgi:hypothetical protein